MKTTEFTMPEITISYKDNVKASERIKILSSETSYSYLKPFYSECMEHHEESYVMFLNLSLIHISSNTKPHRNADVG